MAGGFPTGNAAHPLRDGCPETASKLRGLLRVGTSNVATGNFSAIAGTKREFLLCSSAVKPTRVVLESAPPCNIFLGVALGVATKTLSTM